MRPGLLLTLLLSLSAPLQAQNLSGKIFGATTENKEILSGASVYWIGSEFGTTANENGVFSLSMEGITDRRLVASFAGYRTDTITIGARTYLSITLNASGKVLQGVEVRKKQQSAYLSTVTPALTEVITQRELTKAACCDLAGCFGTQATVQPQTTNVITNAQELRILGLSGVYNQLLFDGMPVFQGLTYTYGISSYPGTLVSNIYVSKGANSVLQGFEGISGQINVEPVMPDKTNKWLANAYMNSFGEKHFNLNAAFALGKRKKWSTLLAAHVVLPAHKTDRDGDHFLDLPLLTRYMIYNRWKYGSDKGLGLFAHIGLRYLHEKRIGGMTDFRSGIDEGSSKVYGQSVNLSQPELYTKAGYRFNDNHAVVLSAAAYHQDQHSWFGSVRYDAKQMGFYLNLQHEWLWEEKHLLKYGVSYRYLDLEEVIGFNNIQTARTYAGTYRTEMRIPGVFVENVFHWLDDKIVLMAGARADHHQEYGWYLTPRTLLKYTINNKNTLRGTIGTGWRQVAMFPENINLLASSRDIIIAERLKPEQGLNWGFSYTNRLEKGHVKGTLTADFYQTRFTNQFFPDYDSEPTKAIIKNFKGDSKSMGLQLEANLSIYEVLEIRTAYNYLDVYRMENGAKIVLPFNPRNRVMGAISYRPENKRWYFDLNMHWYDRQRLPNTSSYPDPYRRPDYSKPYTLVNAQVTHIWKAFEIYGGCENIFDFRQEKPIIGWQDPFGKYFDVSSVWGPTRGRELYLGIRWKMK